MKTGTPGHGSGIRAGILPGRKREPHIRSPAFRSDYFLAGIFLFRQRGREGEHAGKRGSAEHKKKKKNIYSTCRARTEKKIKRNTAAGRSRKAKRKHPPDRARQRRGDFYGEKKQGRKENIKI